MTTQPHRHTALVDKFSDAVAPAATARHHRGHHHGTGDADSDDSSDSSNGNVASPEPKWATLSYWAKYARYRPHYPHVLFNRILAEVPTERR
eukprot:CAMPEP_0174836712 /NCGR_PEP_ID=MMETSP1114-20130205/6255_1 /TAXON_ID=312471 /ORGANISM="Neobodo designis, Strain CCAP 1951/1" /LENGTH=91 /DNA_ID=CAMNT_0016070721 /DNA_START=34 /DNA_END=306 /DNA_ORIENTATION=-